MHQKNNQKGSAERRKKGKRGLILGLKKQVEQQEKDLVFYKSVYEAVEPIIFSGVPFPEQKMVLDNMFAATVSNAPEDETDNFTAKEASPVFLAISEFLLRMYKIPDVRFLTES